MMSSRDPLNKPLWSQRFQPWKRRTKAIGYCFYFGFVPWWLYENECHYKGWSYGYHLWKNMQLAAKWLLCLEDESDVAFEKEFNNN